MERLIVASELIPVSQGLVWEYASDTTRYAEWVENTVQMFPSAARARLGLEYDEITRVMGPWKTTTHWRVTEFQRPQRQVHEGEGLAVVRAMAVIIDLEPTDRGTVFTLTFRYSPRFGPLGRIVDRVNTRKLTAAQQRSVVSFAALVARETAA